jgi:UDP-glucose 4-epimerase
MIDGTKPALILGGEGFIGSHLVERIPNAIPVDDRSFHKHEFPNTVVMDIAAPEIDGLIANAGLVVHAACRDIRNSMNKPMEDAQTNILGTLNVLMACRRHQVPCFYISSVSVENEVSHYAVSKSAGERYTMMYRQWVPTAMVRLSNVFGPRDTESVVARWLREAEITLIAENATRDFTYVEDTVAGILKAIEVWPAHVVSIGTGVETSLGSLAEWISMRMEKPVRKIAAREIDNVIRRVVDPADAEKRIGFRARWGIFNGLEDYLRKYDRPALKRSTFEAGTSCAPKVPPQSCGG